MALELHPDLTMATLLANYPGARRALFASFHIGGCQSCAYKDEDTLAQVCEQNEIDLSEALRCLEKSHQHDQKMLISPSELKEMLTSEPPPIVLDTRTREEFEGIPFTGAELMTQEKQTELFSQASENPTIILIDHQGRSVLDQCAWFRGHSMKETYGLDGGIDRYAQEIDSSIQRYRLELD